jgi:biotin operon repressor
MRYQRSLEIEKRIQTVLEFIQTGKYSTIGLAAQIGVSIPTISRCVEALREMGHDIRAVRRNGTWQYVLVDSSRRSRASRRRSLAEPVTQ